MPLMPLKKVLFISPTPTHPSNAGNRQHIKSLVGFFKEQNWDTYFLYFAYEDCNVNEMGSYFGSNLFIIPRKDLFDTHKTVKYIIQKLIAKINGYKRKIQLQLGVIKKEEYLYNSELDSGFPTIAKSVIKRLQEKNNFRVVVCEYSFMSKALTFFDSRVLKILDTHDRFTNRFQTYLNNDLKPSWVSYFKSQEQKALKRADVILAVHQADADYFSLLSGKKAFVFNYVPAILNRPWKEFKKTLLYLASANDINLQTIDVFIKMTFPLILKKHPDTILVIGGSICEKLNIQDNNIILKGHVDDLQSFYASGDIFINPETCGTGYKVKALEALSYGMPLVASSAGAAGVTDPFENHLFIADNLIEFAAVINRLFSNSHLLASTSIEALKWIKTYKEKMIKNLLQVIPS